MCLGERKERRPGRNMGLEDCITCVRELYFFLRALVSCFKRGGGGKWREMGDSLQQLSKGVFWQLQFISIQQAKQFCSMSVGSHHASAQFPPIAPQLPLCKSQSPHKPWDTWPVTTLLTSGDPPAMRLQPPQPHCA